MRFNGMRVAHLLRIGPFAISEGEIRCFQDRCRRIEQGFVIFGDHHVANANQGGGLGGLVSHFYPLLVSTEMFRSCLMGAKERPFAMNCASALPTSIYDRPNPDASLRTDERQAPQGRAPGTERGR